MAGPGGDVSYAPHGDGHLAYRTWGEGPPLLYVPSQFVAIADMDDDPAYERFLLGLADFATVIAFDRRGIGLSDPMVGPPTLEDWAEQLASVLDAAGVESAYLLACAFGAMPAVIFAVERASRVRGLVLAMAIGKAPTSEGVDPASVRASATPGVDDPLDMLALLNPSRVGDARFREWWDRAGRRGASPAVARALLELQARSDVTALESELCVPTLVIGRPRHAWAARRPWFGEGVSDARVVEVEGVDWLPWLPDSEAVVAEIEEFVTGARGARVATRTLLTVMFTDVVGSTEAAARLGDAEWRDMLETHDRILRRELGRHAGREVDNAGDGFLSTFATPTEAARCATRLHRAMQEIGIQLRIGIHCGEVEVRQDNIAGIAVHLAARVQAKAGPGETLITSTAREAMVGADVTVSPRGTHELKGVPGRWELFAVEP